MRAIAFHTNGEPEVLHAVDVPQPVPGPGQVLIRVLYAGVNYAEIQHRRGEFGPADGTADVPGLEASGQIVAVGDGVADLAPGDAVAAYLIGFGGYAEYAVAEAPLVTPLGDVDPIVGAGFGCVVPTAYGLITDAGRVGPGESVLIHAAAGGIGTVAAQLARHVGAGSVFGTVGSPDKIEYASGFGYDDVVLRDGFPDSIRDLTGGRGIDAVLDPVGGPTRAASIDLLAPFGRLVAYGDAGQHPDLTIGVREQWKTNRSIGGFNISDLARRDPSRITGYGRAGMNLVATGALRIDITDVLPLAEVAAAHRRMESGTSRGKVVLKVA